MPTTEDRTVFTISLAGVPIRVEALYPVLRDFCRDYITEEPPAVTVAVGRGDIGRERELAARERAAEGVPPRAFSDAYLETLAVYRRIARELLAYDAVVFHGAVVVAEGRAYLFTARSGTGKTTHAQLWLRAIPGAYVLNGDKPLLRLDGDRILACGTPWQGKEHYGRNAIVPLAGVCLLERAAENRIEPISFRDAFPVLMQQVNRPEESAALLRTVDLIGGFAHRVPLYRLGCNMDEEAALVSFRGMRPQGE